MTAPIACLTRQDGALVAKAPRLMPCEVCQDAETCDGSDCPMIDIRPEDVAEEYGDPADMRLEGLSMDEHDEAARKDEDRYWGCYMDARRDKIAEAQED